MKNKVLDKLIKEAVEDYCPKCSSGDIANEDAHDDEGNLFMTCHECSHQWTLIDFIVTYPIKKLLN